VSRKIPEPRGRIKEKIERAKKRVPDGLQMADRRKNEIL